MRQFNVVVMAQNSTTEHMMDIKIAARETASLIISGPNKPYWPDAPESITWPHVLGMLANIADGEITGEKAHRWLGWAQCAIVAAKAGTLEEMKAINHAA